MNVSDEGIEEPLKHGMQVTLKQKSYPSQSKARKETSKYPSTKNTKASKKIKFQH